MRRYRGCFPSVCCVVTLLSLAGCARKPALRDEVVRDRLTHALAAKRPPFDPENSKRTRRVWDETRRFYEANGTQLAWSDARKPRPTVAGLVRALRAADREGLGAADYDVSGLDAARQTFDTDHAIDFDVRCTYAYLRYGWDLTHGSVAPATVAPEWHVQPCALH